MLFYRLISKILWVFVDFSTRICIQEAQLPQRNSLSAAHMEGARPSSPLPAAPSGYTYAYGGIRNPQQTYIKRAVH